MGNSDGEEKFLDWETGSSPNQLFKLEQVKNYLGQWNSLIVHGVFVLFCPSNADELLFQFPLLKTRQDVSDRGHQRDISFYVPLNS